MQQLNVFGQPLKPCSTEPMTGFFRDGHCKTCYEDTGIHTVCVQMTAEFLEFSKSMGNDLSTPRAEFNFPGVKPGEKWCLCAGRWVEAYQNGVAPKVFLEATHEESLAIIPLNTLKEFAL
jgi:uncharacterized protein (DUF2237 family)